MRRNYQFGFIIAALILSAGILFGDNTVLNVWQMRDSLEMHRVKNAEASRAVAELKRRVDDVKQNDDALEKLVREELLLSRSGEMVFIFEDE